VAAVLLAQGLALAGYAYNVMVGQIAVQDRLVVQLLDVLPYPLTIIIAAPAIRIAQEEKLVVVVYVSALLPILIIVELVGMSAQEKLRHVVLGHVLI